MEDFTNYHTQSKEKIKHDGIELFTMHLDDFEGVDGFIDTIPQTFLIQKHVSQANEFKDTCKVMCLSTITINRGSIVDDNIHKYLVTSDINDNTFYKDAELQQCTNTLKFYDKTSVLNDIISVPCVVSSTTVSSLGIDNQDKFDLLEGKIVVQIPSNEKTSTIYEKQRFILGQYSYEVTGIDDITALGVLKISMSKVEKNDKDDFINGIAFNSEEIKNNYKISILSPDLSFAVSQTVQLNVQVTNNDGIVLNPNLTYTSSDTSVFTVDSNGLLTGLAIGTATISVSLTDESTIVATTPINITSIISDNYSVVINGSNSIIKKKQGIYSAKFYNNGVEITTEESYFYLTDINGVALNTNIASIYSQDVNGNCVVLAGNPSGVQYAYLHVKNASGNIVSEGYKIKIYSLI